MRHKERESLERELAREEQRLADLESRCAAARQRVDMLRHRIPARGEPDPNFFRVLSPKTSSEKIALFRSLFRGRTDVFPTRWVNERKGTSGYAPACGNEWVRDVCEKPRVKCGECPNQAFLSVTDRVILEHLRGELVAGVYPLLEDDRCWFLALDFDKGSWKQDVSAFVATCRRWRLPAAVERSRSGNGAHVWFFFSAAIEAKLARQLGCALLTETMSRRHELSMASYDRLFPNQDTLPRGGFGNLIALPFQNEARLKGNTVFVDENFVPLSDQWAFLAQLRRMNPDEVEALARNASRKGQVLGVRSAEPLDAEDEARPWTRSPSVRAPKRAFPGPLPGQVRAVLSQLLYVEKAGLPSTLLNQIQRLAAFQNPEFYKKQALRLSTALTPRIIHCAEDFPEHLALPRGCAGALDELLAELKAELIIDDQRSDGSALDVNFHGELLPFQNEVVRALISAEAGVLVAPPGSGKTVIGARLIAERRRSTLVLVHRVPLLEQWTAQLSAFLSLQPNEIGRIGGGRRRANSRLDIAMIQSLGRRGEVDDIVARYGHVIVDECHHVPAASFERVMREVKARFIIGLTATPHRRDGLHPLLELELGPVRSRVSSKQAVPLFEHRLVVRETGFSLDEDVLRLPIQDLYRRLARDESRNRIILDDVRAALAEGRSPLVLTERRDHLELLADRLRPEIHHLVVLRGGMGVKSRRETTAMMADIPDDEPRLILATGRFAGEGFDDARLDTLFLTLPVSWKGTLVQYAGRLHRRFPSKTEVRIVDYADTQVPMLARMFEKRLRGYRAMGYGSMSETGPPLPLDR